MPQQHFGSEPSKALRLKLAAVDTLLQLCMCVFYRIFSLCFHGLYTRPLWEYAGCCWPVEGLLKSLECEGRRD